MEAAGNADRQNSLRHTRVTKVSLKNESTSLSLRAKPSTVALEYSQQPTNTEFPHGASLSES